jgi:hypothetical protein
VQAGDDDAPRGRDALEQVYEVVGGVGVEARGGLVEDEQPRARDERLGGRGRVN